MGWGFFLFFMLLCLFVLGKMIVEELIKILGVIFAIIAIILIAKLIKWIIDGFYSDDDDDWSWEDN